MPQPTDGDYAMKAIEFVIIAALAIFVFMLGVGMSNSVWRAKLIDADLGVWTVDKNGETNFVIGEKKQN